jgi:hypothetical protein
MLTALFTESMFDLLEMMLTRKCCLLFIYIYKQGHMPFQKALWFFIGLQKGLLSSILRTALSLNTLE